MDHRGHGRPLGRAIGSHYHRIANLQFGVRDVAIRSWHAEPLLRSESFLQKINEFRGAVHDQIWRDGVISSWDGLYLSCCRHDFSSNNNFTNCCFDAIAWAELQPTAPAGRYRRACTPYPDTRD